MSRRGRDLSADHDTFARLFEGSDDGQLVLRKLRELYASKLYVKGPGGERDTCFNLGSNAVLDYIDAMIWKSHNPPPDTDDDSQPAG
jgi:hypothetical protein